MDDQDDIMQESNETLQTMSGKIKDVVEGIILFTITMWKSRKLSLSQCPKCAWFLPNFAVNC